MILNTEEQSEMKIIRCEDCKYFEAVRMQGYCLNEKNERIEGKLIHDWFSCNNARIKEKQVGTGAEE